MPWRLRPIRPYYLPFRPEPDGRTYDPGLEVMTRRIVGVLAIERHPVWRNAPLTEKGRDRVPPQVTKGWEVRRIGEGEPCALILRMMDHNLQGVVLSAAPERAVPRFTDRLLVVTLERLVVVRGADEIDGFTCLADLILGTRPNRRRRRLPAAAVPVEDLDYLQALAL